MKMVGYTIEVNGMNIAICDDHAGDAAQIRDLLIEHFDKNGYIGDIHTFGSGEALLDAFAANPFEAVFLDIYMGGMTGIQAARKLRKLDPNFALVFITSSKDHLMESFAYHPDYYLVKPIKREEIDNAFHNCQAVFLKNARYIEVMCDRSKIKIPCVKIRYAETYGRDTIFHTANGEIKTTAPLQLADLEQELGKAFLRCHQSYLINMNYVESVAPGEFIMLDGSHVPMRKRGRAELRDAYADFISDRLFEVEL
jgi:DNA-binding LytR/AlgR family response regulator